jgi:hypothetical protein
MLRISVYIFFRSTPVDMMSWRQRCRLAENPLQQMLVPM